MIFHGKSSEISKRNSLFSIALKNQKYPFSNAVTNFHYKDLLKTLCVHLNKMENDKDKIKLATRVTYLLSKSLTYQTILISSKIPEKLK